MKCTNDYFKAIANPRKKLKIVLLIFESKLPCTSSDARDACVWSNAIISPQSFKAV